VRLGQKVENTMSCVPSIFIDAPQDATDRRRSLDIRGGDRRRSRGRRCSLKAFDPHDWYSARVCPRLFVVRSPG